ncbi:class II aldolase/adducin family protein [Terribacillus sp. AE2B 122]|uniref:class II aldolase/adducin family protein n=1 Tax=Terribacillus sp. AE2B 122 TaxID=1331902 RepID=UPI001440BFA8|nr:class II aldolase/adducin family protein [Terribacillus sp. AE2B 122]VVM34443.1 class II aldolase/adducin domain protein [Terribacillus sp. AE2B 122]
MLYRREREDLCKVVKIMFDRFETNAAGGNVSVRMSDDHIVMTPTLMAQEKFCDLKPYEILVVDMNEQKIEGEGNITREINMHMACYKQQPDIGCVLHAHPKESMVFATLGMELPNLTEATQKLGKIPTLPFAPATSKELAAIVKEHLSDCPDETLPKAMLLNKHGILVVDKTLRKAYDVLERIEYNAYVASKALLFEALNISKRSKEVHAYNLEE